ncbi:aspartate/glutamate racemase family protein [Methanobrevibacter sp. DSM 116169]|uniref:aspartate/glutamate racemase family protein n=1 Tax=Methanobrevibacter sp. DSM 116169 TaxID=3242727 RepID=UPI0038FC8875
MSSKNTIFDQENINKEVIGVVGGFGSYATLHFFNRLLSAFPAEKEWDRPRILIDNYCTLPSRVRCILYDEHREKIIQGLTSSVQNLINAGATKIIITCNTAHFFLNDVYDNIPGSKNIIIDIIKELAIELKKDNIKEISLIATEGTILSKIYDNTFEKYGIKINSPSNEEFFKMRDLIEVVKQNKEISNNVKKDFINLLKEQKNKSVILGCTEFPVLFDYIKEDISDLEIYDPLEVAIWRLKENDTEN